MKPTPQSIEKFRKRYLEYSVKNVLRQSSFMFVVFLITTFRTDYLWLGVLFAAVASLVFGFGSIALQRYWFKKNKLHIPPEPKYSIKTYKEHQAEREALQKDKT